MESKRKIVTNIFKESVLVRTLEPMEIFAAKANALMSRAAAKDLYDFNNMIYFGLFDESEYELFRKCIIFYASILAEKINRTFDTSAIDRLDFSKMSQKCNGAFWIKKKILCCLQSMELIRKIS